VAPKVIIAATNDVLAARNLRRVAERLGLTLRILPDVRDLDRLSDVPLAVIVDLEQEGGLDVAGRLDARWPNLLIAGFVSVPSGELWRAAQDAGCDVVTTRGALAKQLGRKLLQWMERPGGPRMSLFSVAEAAGRVGLVQRLEETPRGPLAVYHLGNRLFVVQDVCPHAGAKLSEGDLDVDSGIITCPRHGSRFDAHTGERVRGPSDEPIRTYRVVVEAGEAYAQLD
jgi:nitrite reductase/ring-hydroxylating ferredoxin subunit